jgi:ABC-type transport system involved in Fe-S cluster assembly fused permease/ATPase subunit
MGKGNFNIAKSILDLIYTQALLWLGFFYSPFLPFVILVTSFMLFYVKKVRSHTHNQAPPTS